MLSYQKRQQNWVSEAIVTGSLGSNKAQHDSGLVAYAEERWDVEYDSEDGYEGDGETLEGVWPSLLLLTSSGQIRTAAVNSAQYGGNRYSEVIHYSDSSTTVEGIPDGSIRVTGYRNGNTVTVAGHRNEGGLLVPARFYGGTRDALIREQRQASWFATGFGVLFMVLGPLISVSGLVQAVRGRAWVLGAVLQISC